MSARLKKYLTWFLVLVYVSGAIGFLIRPSFFRPFTPFTLLLTCFVFLIHQPLNKIRYVLAFITVACIGFAAEAIGVKTGWMFGSYHYGAGLGCKLLAVPLIISLNWALLINAGILTGFHFFKNQAAAAFVSAAIITGIDFLIEQSAAQLNFWYFKNGIAGLHNYIGWFVLSFAIAFFAHKELARGDKKSAGLILALQLFFFGFLYIFKIFNFTW